MRFDGWIFMAVSWLAILALFVYSLFRILRSKSTGCPTADSSKHV
jgi:uncharacterized membrane protein